MIAAIFFWFFVFLLAYVYVGYPALVYFVSKIWPRKVERGDIEPTVTVLITAYNEEKSIAAKLENSLSLDYPKEKLEILVASDGSTDNTDEIVKTFADRNVGLFRQEGRKGKTLTQNGAVRSSNGEIILFTDATTVLSTDVLKRILPSFNDSTVGCVSGRLKYVDQAETSVGSGAQSYWSYETNLKASESRACSLIGASGCLYAVRRTAYRDLASDACSDFVICSDLYRRGFRSVFEPDALSIEDTNAATRDEMNMRVRVIVQTLNDLWQNRDLLNPFKFGFFAVELFSHKVLRYSVPVILLMMLISNAFAATTGSALYLVLLGLQAAFYVSALFGWILERIGLKVKLLVIPLYFVLANTASVIAAYRFLRGKRYSTWEPIRN